MTEVLHSPSSSSSSSLSTLFESLNQESPESEGFSRVTVCDESDSYMNDSENNNNRDNNSNSNSNQLSLLEFLLSLLKKSFGVSNNSGKVAEESLDQFSGMEIGWPTDVRHVAHVTFDRFNGFLGLPVEFEPEVLRRAPSASATVFGVSTESMQLTYDSRGNSIPVILILMQQRLYTQGGLQAEGIFRINADNSQEEQLRNQLNSGIVPDGIDVHCLAGLIKAWFRELPTGVLDPLAPEQVIQCHSEEDCFALCRTLPPTETALLDWAINLMADVVQNEHLNKMNSHNIAMVFAPNMTHMVDPLTALMYAVQVMNFLKSLITKTLREREDRVVESHPVPPREPSDENGDQGPTLNLNPQDNVTASQESESDGAGFCEWPVQSPPVEPKTRPVSQSREPKPAQSSDPEKNQPLATNLSSINNQIKRRETWR